MPARAGDRLGGPDALSVTMNASGEIAGQSYANATANAVTKVPTQGGGTAT
jgi:hypothetical protein